MKPEMKMDGTTYTLTTTIGETVKLSYADVQEIEKFLRHRRWTEEILELLSEEGIALLGGEKEKFIDECLEEAENRYEIYVEPVDINDIFCYIAENWGIL